jgi:hypothetical protein
MWYGLNPVTGKMPVPQVLLLKWKHYMLGFVPQPNLRIKIFLICTPILWKNTGAPIVPCGGDFS